MRDINDVVYYPSYVNSIMIPTDRDSPYNVIFYPENSSFLAGYRYLGIRQTYVRRITYHGSLVPILRCTRDRMKPYLDRHQLVPFVGSPPRNNFFTDETPFLRKIDKIYKPVPFRRVDIIQKVIRHMVESAEAAPQHKSILVYYVDKTLPVIKNYLYRRSYPLFKLYQTHGGEFPFHIVVMAIRYAGGIKYQMLWHAEKGRKFDVNRLRQIFQNLFTFSGKPVDMNAGEFDD